jgi:hypothetical protein
MSRGVGVFFFNYFKDFELLVLQCGFNCLLFLNHCCFFFIKKLVS